MKVGLMADSHDRLPAVAELLQLMREGGATMVLHAGDYVSPLVLNDTAFTSLGPRPERMTGCSGCRSSSGPALMPPGWECSWPSGPATDLPGKWNRSPSADR